MSNSETTKADMKKVDASTGQVVAADASDAADARAEARADAAIAGKTPAQQLAAKTIESIAKNRPAAAKVVVPDGRERPGTISEVLADRDVASEEAREQPGNHAAPPLTDSGTPTTRATTTNPIMGLPDDTEFVTEKQAAKQAKDK